jgi:hypothetical protein
VDSALALICRGGGFEKPELPLALVFLLHREDPRIVGASFAVAGMHAHMIPTDVSTVLQIPTGTKSSVGLFQFSCQER